MDEIRPARYGKFGISHPQRERDRETGRRDLKEGEEGHGRGRGGGLCFPPYFSHELGPVRRGVKNLQEAKYNWSPKKEEFGGIIGFPPKTSIALSQSGSETGDSLSALIPPMGKLKYLKGVPPRSPKTRPCLLGTQMTQYRALAKMSEFHDEEKMCNKN